MFVCVCECVCVYSSFLNILTKTYWQDIYLSI